MNISPHKYDIVPSIGLSSPMVSEAFPHPLFKETYARDQLNADPRSLTAIKDFK
jgi:hypothetical protein